MAVGIEQTLLLQNCNRDILLSRRIINNLVYELCGIIKMHPIGDPVNLLYNVPDSNWGAGITFFLPIAESNILVHTSEFGFCWWKTFSCKPFDLELVKAFVNDRLKARTVKEWVIRLQVPIGLF